MFDERLNLNTEMVLNTRFHVSRYGKLRERNCLSFDRKQVDLKPIPLK